MTTSFIRPEISETEQARQSGYDAGYEDANTLRAETLAEIRRLGDQAVVDLARLGIGVNWRDDGVLLRRLDGLTDDKWHAFVVAFEKWWEQAEAEFVASREVGR